MTRIDLIEEEESSSDNISTASCNTTDEVAENFVETDRETLEEALRQFQQEQLDNEAAQEYYRYCRYYYRHINPDESDNCDDDFLNAQAIDEEKKQYEGKFRRELVASVLSYFFQLANRNDDGQKSMNKDLELRPKFAILKHKPEILHSSSVGLPKSGAANQTPEWYFNMPDTPTPFPDFGSKIEDHDN